MIIRSKPKPTILVVDDSEINRDLLHEYLSKEYNVILASNGAEALNLMDEFFDQIKLVLLDIVMPNINGFEILEEMHENGWIETLPVVIVSAEGSAEFRRRAYLNNVYNFISKPFTYEEVMSCVKRILS